MDNRFTQSDTILKLIDEIPKGKQYSDIVDAEGNQYVDLVQEGGGVLGIALVGYTYILEKAGIRFMSLAGTSAGAINTMMMAGLGEIQDAKSEKVLEIIKNQNLSELMDGPKFVKKIVNKLLKGNPSLLWKLWNGYRVFRVLMKKLGLNPGTFFENWITTELRKNSINTLKDLQELRNKLPIGLKNVITEKEVSDIEPKLAIITSDITTNTKTEFPRMAKLYWSNPEQIAPSKLVRASMSIPYFFEPFEIKDIPNSGSKNNKDWVDNAGYAGPVPPSVKFVDGGMLSNFPINVFHRKDGGVPRMPTFGVRLSTFRKDFNKTDSLMGISSSMISTMRQIHDYDFLLKNPDYKKLICPINADQDPRFHWLDFNMTKDQQRELFNLGAESAVKFLKDFDWEGYKKIRKGQ